MSHQIPRKAVLSFSSNILITSFGLISLIFVKRYYGFEAVGMIAFSISYMALFSLISDLGLSVSHRKIVNEVGADDGICNGTFLFLKTFLNILMVILVILSFSIFENLAQNSSDEHLFRMLFIIFLINKFTTNLFGSLKVIYTTKLEIAISAMPRIFFRFLQMIMKVVISILGFSILYICATEIFIALCILLTYIYFFRNNSYTIINFIHICIIKVIQANLYECFFCNSFYIVIYRFFIMLRWEIYWGHTLYYKYSIYYTLKTHYSLLYRL